MPDTTLSLSAAFPEASEADWLAAVSSALKGKGAESLLKPTAEGLSIKPLYRRSDAEGELGGPGVAPFLRGATAAPDIYLPWDIRQVFAHPSPEITNREILRDLERGVSSLEIAIAWRGAHGVQIDSAKDLAGALKGVDARIATVALDAPMAASAWLAEWAGHYGGAGARLDFNLDPVGETARLGEARFDVDALAKAAALARAFPDAGIFRWDARAVHEAGGSDAQELAFLLASAVETLRRLDGKVDAGFDRAVFCLALDANYGTGIAKLRAARRLWAFASEAMGAKPAPIRLQAVTSARMLTQYDPWTNILRNTCAAFAGAAGGADILTVRAFNEALGLPEELGRRIARNTQIIAMEESQIGRVADPLGGAFFAEAHADALAERAWTLFQEIESEGGVLVSLEKGALQARVSDTLKARMKDIGKRKTAITGVSEFPLLDEIAAPVADAKRGILEAGTKALVPVRLAAPFEALRDKAKGSPKAKVFLATLGPVAEFSARADFARNLFAAGGLAAVEAPVPPKTPSEAAAAFRASGTRLACLCGSDTRYTDEAAAMAKALKEAGAVRIFLAGKFEAPGIDTNVFMGADVLHALALAHAELGL
jgi:methylmalonyl-CoA mutase